MKLYQKEIWGKEDITFLSCLIYIQKKIQNVLDESTGAKENLSEKPGLTYILKNLSFLKNS